MGSSILFLYILLAWLFRRTGFDNISKDVIVSPKSGRVLSIKSGYSHHLIGDDLLEVEVGYNFIGGYGLYFPCCGEVCDFYDEHGNKKILVLFQSDDGYKIGISIRKNIFGFYPRIWLSVGDRGSCGANFGYFPFGGKILLYIPKDFDVAVDIGSRLCGGKSIIAVIAGAKD